MRLPVTIVAGFLGSGKTTLVNHILSQQTGRTAVIVNEFAELAIDPDLIVATEGDLLELANGCICCSLQSGLTDAVERVLERRPDALVIETSGVSDPLGVALALHGAELRRRVRVDAIITVVDATSVMEDQVRHADFLLLNKADLVDDLGPVETRLRELNPRARLARTTRCRVPLPLILGVGLFEPRALEPSAHVDYESVSFESDRPFGAHAFQAFLEGLPERVFRGKGLLWIEESPQRYVFHLVGRRFTLDPTEVAGLNRLVLIGRELDAEGLRRQLKDCLRGGGSAGA